jgi:hypothetical protein
VPFRLLRRQRQYLGGGRAGRQTRESQAVPAAYSSARQVATSPATSLPATPSTHTCSTYTHTHSQPHSQVAAQHPSPAPSRVVVEVPGFQRALQSCLPVVLNLPGGQGSRQRGRNEAFSTASSRDRLGSSSTCSRGGRGSSVSGTRTESVARAAAAAAVAAAIKEATAAAAAAAVLPMLTHLGNVFGALR